ncbi:MAG: rubrerythrin family protein [Chloroflexota bacterium]|nr:rubrerythrin family protein [Chloroflexota bacterium]
MTKTANNLEIAFASESQTNIEYLAYAHKAMDEGLMEIAQLFREAAGAEVIHALSHLKALGAVNTTKDNLKEAAEGEDIEILSMYPKFIKDAEDEGQEEAARSFRLAFEREKHHRTMFRHALRNLK